MNTHTAGLCSAGDQILSIVHMKQTVYQLRHISSPPSFLIRFLGWDCHSVVDCVPGPRSDPQHCKHAGCSMCEGSVPSSKKQVGPGTADSGTTLLCAMLPIPQCEAHRAFSVGLTVSGAISEDTGGSSLTEHNPLHLEGEQKTRVMAWSAFLLGNWLTPTRNEIRNMIAQLWAQCLDSSVPVPLALRIVFPRHLQVVEVEVGHHVTHGQHQPVQALIAVRTPGHSFLQPLPLCGVIWQQ